MRHTLNDTPEIVAAREQLQEAWQALADATHHLNDKHHVNVHVFKIGLSCSRCAGSWDGFWEHYDSRLCRSCGDAILTEVMG